MLPSLILNGLNCILVAGCIVWGLKKANPKSALFRYFTTLSNVLCAIASLAVAIAELCGGLPFWVQLLKYAGTAAVTVTMLTVFFFLGPVSHEWKALLTNAEFFLHLFCPLLAIVSFLVFEKTAMPVWTIAVGAAPVPVYGALYMHKVVYAPEPKRWDDFYGFNRNGKWPLSFALMTLGGVLIALAFWAV